MQWLMWQMSGLGPMLGQHGHFALYAPEKIPYAIERYRDEAARLYRVLDTQLGKTGAYVAGRLFDCRHRLLSLDHDPQGAGLHARRLSATSSAGMPTCARGRKVQAGLAIGKFVKEPFDEEARKNMFGQDAKEMAGEEIVSRHPRAPLAGRGRNRIARRDPGDGGTGLSISHRSVENAPAAPTFSPQERAEGAKNNQKETHHDRILLRLLQSLDLSRLPQHPAAGEGVRRRDFVAADPGRRHLQHASIPASMPRARRRCR